MAKNKNMVSAPAARLSWREVGAWRTKAHFLDQRVPREKMLEVVAQISGLHAQLMSSAEMTLWARVDQLQPDDVANALWEERRLIKTWAMRGTLHLLPAAEFPKWQAALSLFRHYLKPAWFKAFGVTQAELEQLLAAVGQALNGNMLTRQELADEVSKITGSLELGDKLRESWGAMLKPAAFRGKLCFAPSQGQNVRFTRPDWWLNGWEQVEPELAMREATRRFLASCAPATSEDFGRWWGGLTPSQTNKLFHSLGEEAVQVEVEGTPGRMLVKDVAGAQGAAVSGVVRLLPAFDQYVIGATLHASHLMPGDFKERVYRQQGWLSPVLLVDGQMEGIWKHERKGNKLLVQIEPFGKLPQWVRQGVEEEAERLAAFLGGKLELSWQT